MFHKIKKYFENKLEELVQLAKEIEEDNIQGCLEGDLPDNQSDDPYTIDMIKSIHQENRKARYI